MVETIFTNPVFVETILPFLLMFTIIFAILQKTKIFGEGKKQIDAIIALVIALLFISFGRATDIVVEMIPILGIALMVILVFMILVGSMFEEGKFAMHKYLQIGIGIAIGVLVSGTALVLTGGLDFIIGFIYGDNTGLLINGILVVVIAAAIAAVVFTGKDEDKGKNK